MAHGGGRLGFETLGFSSPLLEAVRAMGYVTPTSVQQQAIPLILAGRDVVACAQTGTGKTAAFVLPTLQRLHGHPPGLRALVVTPTRELAVQIEGVARTAAEVTRHRVRAVFGGVGYEPQVRALRHGVDLLVATPGRLLDLHQRGDLRLDRIEILVLDEADRMLDMGFWPDVRRILGLLPPRRQNLLFSATMPPAVLETVRTTLVDPARIEITRTTTPVAAIEQHVVPVDGRAKNELLVRLIEHQRLDRVLVFTRTKHRADRLAKVLDRSGIRGAAIHGNRSQNQRQRALDGFREGRVRVLVATDIVSRGIDVDDISHVINFDMPGSPEDYVHRIGRTGRAGRSGKAISFLAPEDLGALRDIERGIGRTLERVDPSGLDQGRARQRHVAAGRK